MGPELKASLAAIGQDLNAGRQIRVHDRGVIRPSSSTGHSQPQGMETTNGERWEQTGSAPRSRERAARGKGPSRGSRSAGAAPRIGGDVLRAAYEGQVKRLAEAYPSLQTYPDNDGMWLLAKSSIMSGLAREATFLVALPYRSGAGPQAWGFWTTPDRAWWIGPRHTNFLNGSICAFSPNDGAWTEGGDLQTLLDLYSVWALRHLHLEVFGRWAGKQYSFGIEPRVQAYYRLRECNDDELCGCGSETRRYAECCKPSDVQRNIIELMSVFMQHVPPGGFATRLPPPSVVGFVEGRSALPRIADVHPNLASAR